MRPGPAAVAAVAGVGALAALIHWKRRGRRTTGELEASAPVCAKCGAAPYLDAAANKMVCAVCECDGAREGRPGDAALDGRGSRVRALGSAWASAEEVDAHRAAVDAGANWAVLEDVVDGAALAQPREVAYEATGAGLGVAYDYENLRTPLAPRPFTVGVDRLRAAVEVAVFGGDRKFFNAAFCNRYTGGGDHVSWHSDEDVPLYGPRPTIASASFGETRDFVLRARDGAGMYRYALGHGDLLVMEGATQEHFDHAVPKRAGAAGTRINVTFRRVLPRQAEL